MIKQRPLHRPGAHISRFRACGDAVSLVGAQFLGYEKWTCASTTRCGFADQRRDRLAGQAGDGLCRPGPCGRTSEAGRSVLWTQALHSRQNLTQRKQAAWSGRGAGASRAILDISPAGQDQGMDGADNVSLPQIAGRQMLDRRRQAVWGWDTAVGEARRIEGYGHFRARARSLTSHGRRRAGRARLTDQCTTWAAVARVSQSPPCPAWSR